jgi:hypothetical protein
MSAGAVFGPMALAVEDRRLKAAILLAGGLPLTGPTNSMPAVEPINHVTRVRTPTIIINGELDFTFPLITSQRPLYSLLGTPDEQKKLQLYPGGHGIFGLFRKQIQADINDWLDQHLGPVK